METVLGVLSWNCMFHSKFTLNFLVIPGTLKNFLPKPKPFSNYIFDLLYISDLFFPGNQRAIFNITLGTKYVQQIAIGNINKDCHRGLDLQYWQKAKKHK